MSVNIYIYLKYYVSTIFLNHAFAHLHIYIKHKIRCLGFAICYFIIIFLSNSLDRFTHFKSLKIENFILKFKSLYINTLPLICLTFRYNG